MGSTQAQELQQKLAEAEKLADAAYVASELANGGDEALEQEYKAACTHVRVLKTLIARVS